MSPIFDAFIYDVSGSPRTVVSPQEGEELVVQNIGFSNSASDQVRVEGLGVTVVSALLLVGNVHCENFEVGEWVEAWEGSGLLPTFTPMHPESPFPVLLVLEGRLMGDSVLLVGLGGNCEEWRARVTVDGAATGVALVCDGDVLVVRPPVGASRDLVGTTVEEAGESLLNRGGSVTGLIIGVVVGVVLLIAILIFVVFRVTRRKFSDEKLAGMIPEDGTEVEEVSDLVSAVRTG